jgi:hypothetical protein
VRRWDELDRSLVRRQFENRFVARRMALEYLSLYQCMALEEQPDLSLVAWRANLDVLSRK